MSWFGFTDPPTVRDRRRMRDARKRSRVSCGEANDAMATMLDGVFKDEIGQTVRSASPFLIALLDHVSLTLDVAAHYIVPVRGWPERPRLTFGNGLGQKQAQHMLRHYLAALAKSGKRALPLSESAHGATFELNERDRLRLHVIGHSLEADAWIDGVRFETCFGTLRIELAEPLPETVAIAAIGKPLAEIVDHGALRGKRWHVAEVELIQRVGRGQTLVVETGSTSYRLPWARKKVA